MDWNETDTTTFQTKQLKQSYEELSDAIQRNHWQAVDKGHVALFATRLNTTVELVTEEVFSNVVLKLLDFQDLRYRHDAIPEAHRDTFNWIYRPSSQMDDHPWDDFTSWLRTSEHGNLYWVTGKPGSGKSTLMKFIYDNPQTVENLKVWAESQPLVLAGFFFWNSGTVMQMSRMGLLQSLLYQLLRALPHLVPEIFSERWQSYTSIGTAGDIWTWSELKRAIQTLLSRQDLRTALFLDGLDEFDGDHQELVELIVGMRNLPNVKICSASRPWPVFEDAFENKPSLQLERLTERDIMKYVADKLGQNMHYLRLRDREPDYASNLEQNIVEKASGVFLWVYLVVKSLLQGLTNADRTLDLQKRLDSLPEDLEALFEKLLGSLEPLYFSQACQMLQIVTTAQHPPSALVFAFADDPDDSVAINTKVAPLSDDISALLKESRRRLSSRSKGLLEAVHFSDKRGHVRFLHRTVKDFILQPHIGNRIAAGAGEGFDPNRRLANGFLREIKGIGLSYENTYADFDYHRHRRAIYPSTGSFAWALDYAFRSQQATGKVPVDFLDALDNTIQDLQSNRYGDLYAYLSNRFELGNYSFFGLAFSYGHHRYVQSKLDPTSVHAYLPPMDVLIVTFIFVSSAGERLSKEKNNRLYHGVKAAAECVATKEICAMLLKRGADAERLSKCASFSLMSKEIRDLVKSHVRRQRYQRFLGLCR